MNKKTIQQIDPAGKRVLVRCDFNVPLDGETITDNKRIVEALPTIRSLIERGGRVILCSHLGRPKGKADPRYSLAPVARELERLLGQPVLFASDIVGESAHALADSLQDGQILLLENVRFDPREEKNDPDFARELAGLAEVYVNDAFGTAHRAHASTAGVADYLPAVCGCLIEKEIGFLGRALNAPERPFVAILGGAKVSDKIGVIRSLLQKVDSIIIGGGMAYTFAKAQGGRIGDSICEDDKLDLARELLADAQARGVRFLLPVDTVAADAFAGDANTQIVPTGAIPEGWQGLDIGPESRELFAREIAGAATVVWNGPMGVFEMPAFAAGTEAVAKALADSPAVSIIGGGDSAAAVAKLGYADRMSHISTGGGASLEFLEGIELPGIACLENA
ncbi:MAG: phosphoglycerate kinase [Clostridiales bacterium]|nr:phosphoglycerate kinase [Clostridiales bacterium]